jgi:hypothetical protein
MSLVDDVGQVFLAARGGVIFNCVDLDGFLVVLAITFSTA